MNKTGKQNGFSLTEVLIATAILAVGLMMIAMAFPVGVKLTTLATERTVGTVAANEAFAKFQLYSRDPDGAGPFTAIDFANKIPNWTTSHSNLPEMVSLMSNLPASVLFLSVLSGNNEQWYPSVVPVEERKYHWSIIARQTVVNVNELQVTAFVTRVMDGSGGYYDMVGAKASPLPLDYPAPVTVKVTVKPADANEVAIDITSPLNYNIAAANVLLFFIEGCMIVDDATGEIYRVVEIKDSDAAVGKETLVLNRPYSSFGAKLIWVVPPAVGSTRNPCIFVQQKTIGF